MSYILDALNKSEKEQHSQSVPSINIHHQAKVPGSRWYLYLSVFIILLLANGITIYLWIKNDSPVKQQTALENSSGNETISISPSTRPASTSLAPLSSLPVPVQQNVRALIFSSHIYSEHPDLRAVNINGITYYESDMLSNGLRLEQVTPEGVVLNYQDRRFEVSVVEDWYGGA